MQRQPLTRRSTRWAATCLILLGLMNQGVAQDDVMTPMDVARIRTVTSAAMAPDGKHIAYTVSVQRQLNDEENGPAWTELHVVDPAGNSRAFVTGKVNVSAVQFTPSGDGIAYVGKRGDDKFSSLYVVPLDGGESQRRLSHGASMRSVTFSHDGSHIAFIATEPVDPAMQNWKDKGFNQEIYEEDWQNPKVWIAKADGSTPPRALDLPGAVFSIAWSPTGRQIAVALAPTPLVDHSYMFKRVRVVDIDSSKVVEAIDNPGKLGAIAWSPDGARIAMVSGADLGDPKDGRLMVASVPGDGSLTDLMPDYDAHVSAFKWLNDDSIAFLAGEGTGSRVGFVNLEKEVTTWVEGNETIFNGLSISADGSKVAMVGETSSHPGEVFMMEAGSPPKRLTHTNPWLAEKRLARQEVVQWKAEDGLELEGILIYPLNYQEGRRYPMIMTVHGGPEAHIANGWLTRYSYAGQVGAARGFAVFYPNYRGSTGRGVAFSKMGQADAAGKEFDDLVDAIDHLVAAGIVDTNRVGITGGSYGGYASAWGATYYSERFAASVMFVGISDNVSKVGTTDIPEEMFLVHHLKRLWDDWDYFLQSSPIRHVQKNRTPTLILHGKADPRVHPSQSLELFRHLKTLGQAPVRLVFYPGEGHGNRRAAARFDYNLRLLRWMEHFLQDDGKQAPVHQLDYETLLK